MPTTTAPAPRNQALADRQLPLPVDAKVPYAVVEGLRCVGEVVAADVDVTGVRSIITESGFIREVTGTSGELYAEVMQAGMDQALRDVGVPHADLRFVEFDGTTRLDDMAVHLEFQGRPVTVNVNLKLEQDSSGHSRIVRGTSLAKSATNTAVPTRDEIIDAVFDAADRGQVVASLVLAFVGPERPRVEEPTRVFCYDAVAGLAWHDGPFLPSPGPDGFEFSAPGAKAGSFAFYLTEGLLLQAHHERADRECRRLSRGLVGDAVPTEVTGKLAICRWQKMYDHDLNRHRAECDAMKARIGERGLPEVPTSMRGFE